MISLTKQGSRVLLAIGLVAGIALCPGAVAHASNDADAFREAAVSLPDAASLTGPALAAGRLTDTRGRAISGATVVLAVEPSNKMLSAMRVGDSYRERFLVRGTTDKTGAWTLRLPASTDLHGNLSKGGVVNFEVLSAGQTWKAASYFNSVGAYVQANAVAKAGVAVVADSARSLALPVATSSLHVNLQARADPTQALSALDGSSPLACVTKLYADEGSRQAIVGETFSDASDVTSHFIYTNGATSELGVGVSASGAFSGYSASGTVGVTRSSGSTGTSSFAPVTGAVNQALKTEFDVRIYETAGSGCLPWTTKATAWDGGAAPYSISDVAMGDCVGYARGTTYGITTTSASTSSSGLSVSAIIGINLSSRTGYSSTGELTYYMAGSNGHPVCGKNAKPGGAVGLVMVHSTVWNG